MSRLHFLDDVLEKEFFLSLRKNNNKPISFYKQVLEFLHLRYTLPSNSKMTIELEQKTRNSMSGILWHAKHYTTDMQNKPLSNDDTDTYYLFKPQTFVSHETFPLVIQGDGQAYDFENGVLTTNPTQIKVHFLEIPHAYNHNVTLKKSVLSNK